MTTIFDELAAALREQEQSEEFPLFLFPTLWHIANNPEQYADREPIVETLLMQVQEYETYAESGCCKTAFDSEDIKVTLRRLGHETLMSGDSHSRVS